MATLGDAVIIQLTNELQSIERDLDPILDKLKEHRSTAGHAWTLSDEDRSCSLETKMRAIELKISNREQFARMVGTAMGGKAGDLIKTLNRMIGKLLNARRNLPPESFGDGLYSEQMQEIIARGEGVEMLVKHKHIQPALYQAGSPSGDVATAILLGSAILLDLVKGMVLKRKT